MEKKEPIPDCDPEIYHHGEHIATLDASSLAAEAWVKKVADQAQARVDWHYVGGRACVRFLGKQGARNRVFAAINELQGELDGTILRTFGPTDPPPTNILPLAFLRRHKRHQ